MSIQGNINSALSTIGSLVKLDKLAEEQAKQTKLEQERLDMEKLTTKDKDEYLAQLRARGFNFDDSDMDIIESVIGSPEEIEYYKNKLGDDYDKFVSSIEKDLFKEAKETPWQGIPKTSMDDAQYKAYRNIANMKLNEVNNKANISRGNYKQPKVQNPTDVSVANNNYSDNDWRGVTNGTTMFT